MLIFHRGGQKLPLQAPGTFSIERINGAYHNAIIVCVSFVYANNGTYVSRRWQHSNYRYLKPAFQAELWKKSIHSNEFLISE